MGVRLGVRRGLGRRHLPVRRRRAAAVRQGERGALLQGAESEYLLRRRRANIALVHLVQIEYIRFI